MRAGKIQRPEEGPTPVQKPVPEEVPGSEAILPSEDRPDAAGALEIPELVRALDLGLPALIEASAGTGKTYTLEHLLLRIVLQHPSVGLDQVLVLTYTEKATGELREKIRRRLQEAASHPALSPAARERVKEALLGFDGAAIHTIHGFCRRVLKDHAFENDALFEYDLRDDSEIFAACLREEMRSTWHREGPDLLPILARLRVLQRSPEEDARLGPLCRLASDFDPARGDRLEPSFDPAPSAEAESRLAESLRRLHRLLKGNPSGINSEGTPGGRSPDVPEDPHPLLVELLALPACRSKADLKKQLQAAFAGALRLVDRCEAARFGPACRAEAESFFAALPGRKLKQEGFSPLLPEGTGSGGLSHFVRLLDVLPSYLRLLKEADHRRSFAAAHRIVHSLRRRVEAYKKRHGVKGFSDLIREVHAAVRLNPELRQALSGHYRFCLVDEFQDTDYQQWEIFRRLFLDGGRGGLFLIGDPKQAIYGFRGADVQTYLNARARLASLARDGGAQGHGLAANYRSCQGLLSAFNALFGHPAWFGGGEDGARQGRWSLGPPPAAAAETAGGERAELAPSAPSAEEARPRITYSSITFGGSERQRCLDFTPHAAPLVAFDFRRFSRKEEALAASYDRMAREIRRLLEAPQALQVPVEGSEAAAEGGAGPRFRPLEPRDICVLVRKNYEADRFQQYLRRYALPHAIYKKDGLYQGDEAYHLYCLLAHLERPRDFSRLSRALWTRFFPREARPEGGSAPARDLLSLGLGHPLLALLEKWRSLALRGRWPALFRSLLHESGLLARELLHSDGDRRVMNFIHLAHNLSAEAQKEALDLSALLERLERNIATGSLKEGETDLHRLESEKSKISLMTMHISKGLEFPVVFVAGGFEAPRAQGFIAYRAEGSGPDGGGTVFALDPEDGEAEAAYLRQAGEEDRRLFYVALTRARYKLYLPLIAPRLRRCEPGPLGTFIPEALEAARRLDPSLFAVVGPEEEDAGADSEEEAVSEEGAESEDGAKSLDGAVSAEALDSEEGTRSEEALVSAAGGGSGEGSISEAGRPAAPPKAGSAEVTYPATPLLPPGTSFARRALRLESYSRLAHSRQLPMDNLTEAPLRVSDEPRSEAPPAGPETLFPLPPGAAAGNMLHEALEEVDFAAVAACAAGSDLLGLRAVERTLRDKLDKHRLPQEAAPEAARLLHLALTTRLPDALPGGRPFRLGDLAKKRHEVEFFLPFGGPGGASGPSGDSGGSAADPSRGPGGASRSGPLPNSGSGPAPGFGPGLAPGPSPARPAFGIPDITQRQGYLWGFIDLVFEKDGRFYFLDWKSDTLPAYGPGALSRHMAEARYDLQYMLYTLAMDRWLSRTVPGYRFETHFGGFYYLFLRGLERAPSPGPAMTGVFFLRPEKAWLEREWPSRLDALLHLPGDGA